MFRTPRPGRRVKITNGALVGKQGVVVDSIIPDSRKVTVRLDPPDHWAGQTLVRVRPAKLRVVR